MGLLEMLSGVADKAVGKGHRGAFVRGLLDMELQDDASGSEAETYRNAQAISYAPGPLGAIKAAITPATAVALGKMSKADFLGVPKIVGKGDAAALKPRALRGLDEVQAEPFLDGRFTARYTPDGAAVFDGDKVIASYNFGDTLVVDPKYRKQGIGEELVYQQRTYFPEQAKAATRNKVSQQIQENVWERIQRDLNDPALTVPAPIQR